MQAELINNRIPSFEELRKIPQDFFEEELRQEFDQLHIHVKDEILKSHRMGRTSCSVVVDRLHKQTVDKMIDLLQKKDYKCQLKHIDLEVEIRNEIVIELI